MSNSTSNAPPITDQPASKISQTALFGIIWALCGLAITFVIARITVRIRFSRKLFADDYFCLLALSILIGNTVLTQLMAPPMYKILDVSTGRAEPGASFMARSTFYLKAQLASTVLFWSCLWAVKGAFLAFFRRLTNQTKWPRIAWWVVVAITVLAYIGSVITYPVSCTSFVLGECQTPTNIQRSLISLRYSTAVDIITDLMIMALPMWLIFGLKMSRSQKIGLCGVLGLGVVIIIFSVIRIIVTNTIGSQPEVSWLALWSSIESSVAVIVACLASFKVLLSARRGTAYPSPVGARYYGNVSSGRKQTSQQRSNMGTNKSSASRSGHGDLTSVAYDDEEMHDLGAKRGHPTITITGGRDARSKRYNDKPWDNDSESQEHIMTGEDIRVQTTWNIETESRMPHGR